MNVNQHTKILYPRAHTIHNSESLEEIIKFHEGKQKYQAQIQCAL